MLPVFSKLSVTNSTPDSSRGLLKLTDQEKLLVYYGMILYLLRDDDSAIKMKEKYSASIKGNHLFFGNIYRILGLIHHRKVEVKESLEYFKKAEKKFQECGSHYGEALTKYSIGVIYRSKFAEFLEERSSLSPESSQVEAETTKAKDCFR
jgi:hypothetical protein